LDPLPEPQPLQGFQSRCRGSSQLGSALTLRRWDKIEITVSLVVNRGVLIVTDGFGFLDYGTTHLLDGIIYAYARRADNR